MLHYLGSNFNIQKTQNKMQFSTLYFIQLNLYSPNYVKKTYLTCRKTGVVSLC